MGNELAGLVGGRIRAVRKARGLSVRQLADLADVDTGFLGHMEAGRKLPGIETLVKIAGGLDVAPGELLATASRPASPQGLDAQAIGQLKALLARRTPEQKKSVLAVLKLLRDPRRVEGLRAALRR